MITKEKKDINAKSAVVETKSPVIAKVNEVKYPSITWEGKETEPLEFDVFSENIKVGKFTIPDRRAIFRKDAEENSTYLATVSRDYNIVKHSDVVKHVEKQMHFGTKTTVKTILTNNGKQMHRIYTLNDIKVAVRPGDDISPVIRVVNSYDGSTTVNFKCDCVRRVCMNGMIALSNFSRMSYKHFGNKFDINQAFDVEFKHLIRDFENYSKNWTKWIDEKVSDERMALVLNYMPSRLRPLIENRYEENIDGTKYGLYNAYTQALTHDFKSTRAINEDLQKIVLGTYITKIFAKPFYWTASEDEIREDLIRKNIITPDISAEEQKEETSILADIN